MSNQQSPAKSALTRSPPSLAPVGAMQAYLRALQEADALTVITVLAVVALLTVSPQMLDNVYAGLHDCINAGMCVYVLFVASGMNEYHDRSLSGALTLATFVAGQTLSGAVFRKLRELTPHKKNQQDVTVLGVLGMCVGSAVSVYFGVYCAALTAQVPLYHHHRGAPLLPANTFARAICHYDAVQDHQLSIRSGQTIEITITQEHGWVYGVNVAGQGGWFPREFWDECFQPLEAVDGTNMPSNKEEDKFAWRQKAAISSEQAAAGTLDIVASSSAQNLLKTSGPTTFRQEMGKHDKDKLKSVGDKFGKDTHHVLTDDGRKLKDRIQTKDELSSEQLKRLIKLSPEDLALLKKKMEIEEHQEMGGKGKQSRGSPAARVAAAAPANAAQLFGPGGATKAAAEMLVSARRGSKPGKPKGTAPGDVNKGGGAEGEPKKKRKKKRKKS